MQLSKHMSFLLVVALALVTTAQGEIITVDTTVSDNFYDNDNLNVFSPATLTVLPGAVIGTAFDSFGIRASGANIVISGGTVVGANGASTSQNHALAGFSGSTWNISDGNFSAETSSGVGNGAAGIDSIWTISGGVFSGGTVAGSGLSLSTDAVANIDGGLFEGSTRAILVNSGLLNLRGGVLNGGTTDIQTANSGVANVFGSDFLLDGVATAPGMVTASSGMIAGLFPDGDPFSFTFNQQTGGQINLIFEQNNNIVPEPASLAIWSLIGVGLFGFGLHRVRNSELQKAVR